MSTKVSFKAKSGSSASGEIATPAGDGKAPGLILIQEFWGVNDHIRSLADRLAAAGFVTLAPDLYHGTIAKDATEATKLMTELDGDRSMDEIAGAAAFLKSHPRVSGKVGIIGFCMGGAFALRAAANLPEIAAAVPFYGVPDPAKADYAKVRAPIQKHVATRDQWVTVAKAEAIKKQVDAHGPTMELHVYEADHAFMNDTRPEVYAPEAAKLAWDRATAFLHKHLA